MDFPKQGFSCDNSCLISELPLPHHPMSKFPPTRTAPSAPGAPILSTYVDYCCITQAVHLTEPLAPRLLTSQQNTADQKKIEPLPVKFEQRRSLITVGIVLRAQWIAADVKTPDRSVLPSPPSPDRSVPPNHARGQSNAPYHAHQQNDSGLRKFETRLIGWLHQHPSIPIGGWLRRADPAERSARGAQRSMAQECHFGFGNYVWQCAVSRSS